VYGQFIPTFTTHNTFGLKQKSKDCATLCIPNNPAENEYSKITEIAEIQIRVSPWAIRTMVCISPFTRRKHREHPPPINIPLIPDSEGCCYWVNYSAAQHKVVRDNRWMGGCVCIVLVTLLTTDVAENYYQFQGLKG